MLCKDASITSTVDNRAEGGPVPLSYLGCRAIHFWHIQRKTDRERLKQSSSKQPLWLFPLCFQKLVLYLHAQVCSCGAHLPLCPYTAYYQLRLRTQVNPKPEI